MSGRRPPPRQVCPGCKREHRSYKAECVVCRGEMLNNAEAGAALAREQRLGRRQETLDRDRPPSSPVPYNEFPPGY